MYTAVCNRYKMEKRYVTSALWMQICVQQHDATRTHACMSACCMTPSDLNPSCFKIWFCLSAKVIRELKAKEPPTSFSHHFSWFWKVAASEARAQARTACRSNKYWCVSPVVPPVVWNNAGAPSGIPDLGRISILNLQACEVENGEGINH